jgi:hypothetical protein
MAATPIIPQVSLHFCCNSCGAPVTLTETPGGELAYACINARCQRCVHVDCSEGLRVIAMDDTIAITRRLTLNAVERLAYELAGHQLAEVA